MKTIPRCLLYTVFPLVLMLQSCATTAPAVAYFDFGALPKSGGAMPDCALPPIQVSEITSPAALDSNLMLYRLLYDNDQQSRAYAGYRWSMTPARLVALRVKSQLAAMQVKVIDSGMANPGGWQLRLDLSEFSQQFTDPLHSAAQLTLRASVLRANTLSAQTTLTQQKPAAANAPSGAIAMRAATDALITDLNNWLCKLPRP